MRVKDSLVELIEASAELRATGEPYLVATVVRVRGSSYRRPGARLVATASGERTAGSISGGCLEGALLRTAWWRTERGPTVVEFDSSDPDSADAVLGCGGVIEVLVERVDPRAVASDAVASRAVESVASPAVAAVASRADASPGDALAYAARIVAAERRGAIATVFATTRAGEPIGQRWFVDAADGEAAMPAELADAAARAMASGRASIEHVGSRTILVEPVVPPLALFVFGAGLDAVPIVEQARALGWRAHVWSAAPRFEHAARFAAATSISYDLAATCAAIDRADRAAAIVMSHDLRRDAEALAAVLATRAAYIGALGPRHRTESLLAADPAALADPRLHAPVGLDLGAETPAEIALAAVAEILAADRAATARALRDRRAAAPPELVRA